MPYYAVGSGREAGVYDNWSECQQQVKGYSGASFKKFSTSEGAQNFVQQHQGGGYSGSSGGSRNYSQPSSSYSRSYEPSYSSSYDYEPSYSSGSSSRDKHMECYTDGSCRGNGRSAAQAGIGVYWGPNSDMNVSEPLSGRQTNNRAEIQAAERAAWQAKDAGATDLTINTDSKFLYNSATKWMDNWKQNDWQLASGGPVKNREDFQQLDDATDGLRVKWNHVPSHQGVHGNEEADRLANQGASRRY